MKGTLLSIKECQDVELDIMRHIHTFCVNNDLRYLMAYGTLIGAVRHKGFIPWDNDMDIVMPRPDYEKFLQLAKSKPLDDHLYLVHYSTDKKYHYQCARVCDDRTTVAPTYIREQPSRMGVWVDIFPVDGIPDNWFSWLSRRLQMRILKFKQRANIYALRGGVGWKNKLKSFVYRLFPDSNNKYPRKIDAIAQKTSFGDSACAGDITEWFKTYYGYTPQDFDSPMLFDYGDSQFFGPERFDEILTAEYGDYMTLPPEEKRMTHDLGAMWS